MTTPQVILKVRYDDDPTVYPVLYRPDSQGEDLNRKVNQLFEEKYPDGQFEIYLKVGAHQTRFEKHAIKQYATSLQPTEEDGVQIVYLDCFLKKKNDAPDINFTSDRCDWTKTNS